MDRAHLARARLQRVCAGFVDGAALSPCSHRQRPGLGPSHRGPGRDACFRSVSTGPASARALCSDAVRVSPRLGRFAARRQ